MKTNPPRIVVLRGRLGNGGLLAAVAMMAAGWDGAPVIHAPGFPKNGNWVVKHEGLQPLQ